MRDDDLPLFAWKPECKIIAFPLNKRVGKIRRVAEVWSRKRGGDQKSYWGTQLNTLGRTLERIGYSEEQINAELDLFRDAVSSQISRMRAVGIAPEKDPKGAA